MGFKDGFKDVFKKITQVDEEPNYYGYDDDPIDDDYVGGEVAPEQEEVYAPAQEAYQPVRSQNLNISGSAIELKVVKPESYKNASQIADHLLNSRTVVLNLESTNKETARRLIDFLTGAAYAIGGDIKKVSNNRLLWIRRHNCREVSVNNVLLRNMIDVLETELLEEFRYDCNA